MLARCGAREGECGDVDAVCAVDALAAAARLHRRSVRGVRRGGKLVAEDLSDDHKPDLPQEKQRIIANGGSVTDGSAGRPARVWAHGRIGLAMSRSIGDGECKHVGVIPDPEIKHVKIAAAPADGAEAEPAAEAAAADDGAPPKRPWEACESCSG